MDKWPANYLTANGIKIHYYRTGGDKPPLVLAHGITDTGLCWIRAAQALEKDYDVIMYDARGHGLSDAPETGYTTENHAADLASLIQGLGLEKPGLMGHSMGAATVATVAAKYPALVGYAILEDPPWRAEADTPSATERQARFEEWRTEIIGRKSQSRAEIIASGRQRSPTWDEIEFDPWAEAKLQVSPNVVELVASSGLTWRDLVPQITCPTLLVTGDPDLGAIVTPEVAEAITSLQPQIQVAHIAGAGHNIRREQFERFLGAVTIFIQTVI